MRFNTGHAEVTAEGFSQSRAGSIKASGKAFKGLIDGLYSRKIEAIIRELSTNAFDAHKMVDSIAPFEVHLPSALDPVFWIRDFGPGMTQEFMLNRYPVLFDSTKDGLNPDDGDVDPNNQVGCLGLGRMSFFAYTDACTATVWREGEMSVYAVYMGGDGVIQIALAGSMPSDEPSGVKVEFAVKVKDFASFKESAIRVYKGFPVLPLGLPMDVMEALHVEPMVMGKGWKSYKQDYLPDGGFYARQGCVLYPIDLTQVDGKATEDDEGNVMLSSNYARLANNDNCVVLDFPIGSIGFDLSRERLSYDDATVAALRKRWEEFTKDLQKQVRKQFEALSNPWERMRVAYGGPMQSFGSLFGCSKEAIDASEIRSALWKSFPTTGSAASYGKAFVHAIGHIEHNPLHQTPSHYRYSEQWRAPNESDIVNAALIYIDEKKPHEKVRIGLWMQANDIKWAFVIRPGYLTLKRWRSWGRPTITRMSDIPAIPKAAKMARASSGGGGGGVFDRFKIIHDQHHNYADCTSDASAFDMDDRYFALINKGLYVPMSKSTSWMKLDDVMALHRLVKRACGIDITLINTRINEPDDKWDDYPKFDFLWNSVVDMLPDIFVRRYINTLNRHRYRESWYYGACASWRKANPGSDDPLAAMKRFDDRYEDMPEQDRVLFNYLTSKAGIGGHTYKIPEWEEFAHRMIERARRMGLEVVMPMGSFRSTKTSDNINHRMLPRKWQRIAKIVNTASKNHDKFFNLLLKEATSC